MNRYALVAIALYVAFAFLLASCGSGLDECDQPGGGLPTSLGTGSLLEVCNETSAELTVSLDGIGVGELVPGACRSYEVSPGTYTINGFNPPEGIDVEQTMEAPCGSSARASLR